MKMITCLSILVVLAGSAAVQAESSLDILEPIGKGNTRPFRASSAEICNVDALCQLSFGKAPKKSILIVESVMCASEPPPPPAQNGASILAGVAIVGFIAPSANPNLKILTTAYLPFGANEPISIRLSGADGTVGQCALTGRVLPAG